MRALATLCLLSVSAAYAEEPTPQAPPEASSEVQDANTFGASLQALSAQVMGVSVSWAGYGDVSAVVSGDGERGVGKFIFDAYHFNPIVSAQAGQKARAELELEVEHGGEVIKVEYAVFDVIVNPRLTVRSGKILVPIGEFNDILHPSFKWTQATRPAMMREVIPAIWSDVGVSAFGEFGPQGAPVGDWVVYAVNGLASSEVDPTDATMIRNSRDNYRDNNLDKGVGARVRLFAAKGAAMGDSTFTVSGYTGALDDASAHRWSAVDVAMRMKFGAFNLLAEGAVTTLSDPGDALGLGERDMLTPFEGGLYLYPHVKLGRVVTGARYDLTHTGPRLDDAGALTTPPTAHAVAGSVMYKADTLWNVRAEVSIPVKDAPSPSGQVMAAFYF